MSVMEQAADAILQAARESASLDELSDVEVDGDGSSSLSEIEDKDGEQDEDAEVSDDLSNISDDENDSEAETERLEDSPHKLRPHKDVVLSSHNEDQTYQRSPSKLHNQITADGQDVEEDEEPLSDEDISIHESPDSPKSSVHDEPEREPVTAPTSLEDSSGEGKTMLSAADADTRKRKRSIMGGSGLDDDPDEPMRKRTGSVMTPGDEYAIEEDPHQDEEAEMSNLTSGNILADGGGVTHEEDVPEDTEEPVAAEEDVPETTEIVSPKKRGRKKKRGTENGIHNHEDEQEVVAEGQAALNGDDEARNGEEDHADNEAEDAEVVQKNEEERKSLLCDALNIRLT